MSEVDDQRDSISKKVSSEELAFLDEIQAILDKNEDAADVLAALFFALKGMRGEPAAKAIGTAARLASQVLAIGAASKKRDWPPKALEAALTVRTILTGTLKVLDERLPAKFDG